MRLHEGVALGLALVAMLWVSVCEAQYDERQFSALRGTKVRLHTYGGTQKGVVLGVEGDLVLLRRSSWLTERYPIEGIRRVEVYSRDRNGTLTGMTVGGALGVGVGVGLAEWLDSIDDESGIGDSGAVLMGALGALLGATVGGHVMGAVWTPLEQERSGFGVETNPAALAVIYQRRF